MGWIITFGSILLSAFAFDVFLVARGREEFPVSILAIAAVAGISGVLLCRWARKLLAIPPGIKIRMDRRPPIVVLHTAAYDSFVVEGPSLPVKEEETDPFALLPKDSFLDVLLSEAGQYGPAISLEEVLSSLKEIRSSDIGRRSRIYRFRAMLWMRKAKVIFLCVTDRDDRNDRWEMRQIASFGFISKTIIAIPPLPHVVTQREIQVVEHLLGYSFPEFSNLTSFIDLRVAPPACVMRKSDKASDVRRAIKEITGRLGKTKKVFPVIRMICCGGIAALLPVEFWSIFISDDFRLGHEDWVSVAPWCLLAGLIGAVAAFLVT